MASQVMYGCVTCYIFGCRTDRSCIALAAFKCVLGHSARQLRIPLRVPRNLKLHSLGTTRRRKTTYLAWIV